MSPLTLTTEALGTIALFIGTMVTVLGAGRAAWNRALEKDKRSPDSLKVIMSGATDVVEVLRAELGRMTLQIHTMSERIVTFEYEIERLQKLVDELERERDLWKQRAYDSGYEGDI